MHVSVISKQYIISLYNYMLLISLYISLYNCFNNSFFIKTKKSLINFLIFLYFTIFTHGNQFFASNPFEQKLLNKTNRKSDFQSLTNFQYFKLDRVPYYLRAVATVVLCNNSKRQDTDSEKGNQKSIVYDRKSYSKFVQISNSSQFVLKNIFVFSIVVSK